jgi:sec-independent protein translocase protein TatA
MAFILTGRAADGKQAENRSFVVFYGDHWHSIPEAIRAILYCQEGGCIMRPGPAELIIILIIVVLLFGVGRISKIAGELGRGIREFRKGLSGEETPTEEIKKE